MPKTPKVIVGQLTAKDRLALKALTLEAKAGMLEQSIRGVCKYLALKFVSAAGPEEVPPPKFLLHEMNGRSRLRREKPSSKRDRQ